MPTNIDTLRTGIYAAITTCGPYATNQVSTCDYGVIEKSSGCAIIIHFAEETDDPLTFNGADGTPVEYGEYQFNGELYIRYSGNTTCFLADVYKARDDLKSTFRKTYNLLNTACFAWVNRITFNIDEGYELGGKDWGLMRFVVTVRDM